MTPGGETVSPLNIPAWREFPLRDRLADAHGLPVRVDNDAKALALGEGWLGAAAGRARLRRRWWCRPASAAASWSTAGCSTAPSATPATSATSSSSPTAGRALRRARLPRGRGVGHGDRRDHRAAARPRRRPRCVERTGLLVGRARGVGGQPARPAARRRRRLGGARLRRAVLRRGQRRARARSPASTSRAARASCPPASAPTGPLARRRGRGARGVRPSVRSVTTARPPTLDRRWVVDAGRAVLVPPVAVGDGRRAGGPPGAARAGGGAGRGCPCPTPRTSGSASRPPTAIPPASPNLTTSSPTSTGAGPGATCRPAPNRPVRCPTRQQNSTPTGAARLYPSQP